MNAKEALKKAISNKKRAERFKKSRIYHKIEDAVKEGKGELTSLEPTEFNVQTLKALREDGYKVIRRFRYIDIYWNLK